MRSWLRAPRCWLVVLIVCAVIGTGVTAEVLKTGRVEGTALAAGSATAFTPVGPTRVMDTRSGLGWPRAVTAGQTATLGVGGSGAVPGDAGAVLLNVTVTGPQRAGYVTVYGDAGPRPATSNLNFGPGATVANAAVVQLSGDGKVNFYNASGGTVQLVVDVAGWFASGAGTVGAGGFTPVGPTRVMDTRSGLGWPRAVTAGQTATLGVGGSGAVLLNVTVTGPQRAGYVTVYGDAGPRPATSNLNFGPGATVANAAVVQLSGDGKVNFYNASGGTVQLVVDVAGRFASGAGTVGVGGFTPVGPTRVMDTRSGLGWPRAVTAGQTATLGVGGSGAVPGDAGAVLLNVTVTGPQRAGYVTVYGDAGPRPATSNLNFGPGATVANAAVVQLSGDGKVNFYNASGGTVQLVVDVAGSFNGTGAPASPPVTWCETGLPVSPYETAPSGAVVIAAGDNSNEPFSHSWTLQPNTTYWFAPGVHTLGDGQFDGIGVLPGDVFIGAPGATIDGQGINEYAFEDALTGDLNTQDDHATIEYLTIQHFTAGNGEMVVGQGGSDGWTIKYNLVQDNPAGAGVGIGSNSTVENNCLYNNGDYGYSSLGGATNVRFDHNDVSSNDPTDIPGGIAGAGKFWVTTNVLFTDNYVHDNQGPGFWADTDNAGFLVSGNYFANNGGPTVVFEVSYNAQVTNNTMVGNAWKEVQSNESPSFPAQAIYISESGSDSRVKSNYNAGPFLIANNVLSQNWGGIVLYQNSDRVCGFSSDAICTLINPAVYTLSSCKAHITASSSPSDNPDYYDNCRWKTQNVAVTHNLITFEPDSLPNVYVGGESCTTANAQGATFCGYSAIFSTYSSIAAYPGATEPLAISDQQGNSFSSNSYSGPMGYIAFNQGEQVTWARWRLRVRRQLLGRQGRRPGL